MKKTYVPAKVEWGHRWEQGEIIDLLKEDLKAQCPEFPSDAKIFFHWDDRAGCVSASVKAVVEDSRKQ